MFPIPDWTRLRPPGLRPSGSCGGSYKASLSEGLLALGSFPLMVAGAIAGGVGAQGLLPWLAIPGGIIGLIIAITILSHTILGGISQAAFYGFVTFIFTGGLEKKLGSNYVLDTGLHCRHVVSVGNILAVEESVSKFEASAEYVAIRIHHATPAALRSRCSHLSCANQTGKVPWSLA